ncbi:MAG: AsmA-like C-terminal region-containing protein, partial [Aestuariivirga sp.]
MLNRFKRKPILIAGGLLVLLAVVGIALPGLLSQRFTARLESVSGLSFTNESVHFEFSPPGLALDQAKLSNKAGQILLEAETLHVPLSALWSGTGAPIAFENGALHGYGTDGREHFTVNKIYGSNTLNNDGSFGASGTADVGNVHVIAEASLASLARALSEGSPVDFNLSSKTVKAGYSGRLKLKDGFDLAGTMNLETPDVLSFFTALGANVPIIQQAWPLDFTAAVQTNDDGLSFSNIAGKLGGMHGLGNAVYSAPGGKPTLKLDLGMDVIDLSLFGLGAPSPEGAWREKSYDLAGLDSLDAIWHISSNGLRFGQTEVGAGEFDGSLKDRILEAGYITKDAQVFSAHFSLDNQGFQPAFEATFTAAELDGKTALQSLTGFDWLSGKAAISGKFVASGQTPAAMISNLSGSLNVKLAQAQILGLEASSLLRAALTEPVEGWNGGVTEKIEGQANLNFNDGIGSIQQG